MLRELSYSMAPGPDLPLCKKALYRHGNDQGFTCQGSPGQTPLARHLQPPSA